MAYAAASTTDSTITDTFFEVDGATVHTVQAGSGTPLLLIHGLTGSALNWRRNIATLAQHATVFAIDLPNMGGSGRTPGLDASLAATADRLAACMDALGLAEADIAGHSHGGAVALMFAARHPARVRSLLLFAPANPFCDFGHSLIRFYNTAPGRLLARSIPHLPRWLHAIALGRMYGEPARIVDGSLAGYMDGLCVPGTIDHVLAILRGWHTDMAVLRAALPSLAATPVLLVWGDRDRAVSVSSAADLQRELPRSQIVLIPTGGHVVFEELPEAANDLMVDWLRRDPASRERHPVPRTPRLAASRFRTRSQPTLQPARKSA